MHFDREDENHFHFHNESNLDDQNDFLDHFLSQQLREFPYEIHFWNFHSSMKISDPKAFEFHEEQEYRRDYFLVLNVLKTMVMVTMTKEKTKMKKKKMDSMQQVVWKMKDDYREEQIDCFED